ncbi:hypothetical protein, partial [Enterobacter ludwigii]|uniref:hypothetical protein n=1 Tax=Enterobacter ludwigii TaxID=299767 RepID=UPI001953CB5C
CMTDWGKDAYRDNPQVLIGEGGEAVATCVLDLEVSSIAVAADGLSMLFRVGDGVRHRRVRYRLAQSPHYALL